MTVSRVKIGKCQSLTKPWPWNTPNICYINNETARLRLHRQDPNPSPFPFPQKKKPFSRINWKSVKILHNHNLHIYRTYKKVKFSRYRPGVTQRVGRGIALLLHDSGTRRGWVVSSTPRPHFTHGKDPVPTVQEAVWAPGPVWTDGKSRPHRDSIPGPSSP